jgi:hypothetical protein
MQKSPGKSDLKVLEEVLYNAILGVIYWIVVSFIIALQSYILKKFNLPGLAALLYICPFVIFFWFTHKSSKQIKRSQKRLVLFLSFTLTFSGLVWFFGLLNFTL